MSSAAEVLEEEPSSSVEALAQVVNVQLIVIVVQMGAWLAETARGDAGGELSSLGVLGVHVD